MTHNLITRSPLFMICAICILAGGSCRKLVETDPPTDKLTGTNVFLADATAIAVFNSLFNQMNTTPFQGVSATASISILSGLSADELTLLSNATSPIYLGYYNNALINRFGVQTAGGDDQWGPIYNLIFKCNDALEGLNNSSKLSPDVKTQLTGEAKLLRAFYYFYLVNLFGDVPLALTTDPEVNTLLSRSSKTKVYEQIIDDLKEAEGLLSSNFLDVTLTKTTTERVRPTRWAATALLARAYLCTGEWAKAEDRASAVIANTSLFGPLPTLNNAFLKNSREAIWQIQPTNINLNTAEGQSWIIPATGPGNRNIAILSKTLLNSFEAGDQRKAFGNWIDTTIYSISQAPFRDTVTYVYKYKKDAIASAAGGGVTSTDAMTEYFMVLRLAEQYLIRAEVRARQGKVAEAKADLDVIRTRAGLLGTSANDEASLLTAILEERRHELFCEWGHRWLDLKRTGKINEVMNVVTPIKSNGTVQWQPYQALYPIPYLELQRAPNLVQNPGY